MFTKTDKDWLTKNFATKNDLKAISQTISHQLKPVRQDIKSLKTDVKVLKQDVSGLKKDMFIVKQDVSGLKQDVSSVKKDLSNVKETVEFTKDAVINILDWTQDIHETIVMKKLPERVEKLERFIKSS